MTLAYVVAEMGPKTYVYDSRKGEILNQDNTNKRKREILMKYLKEENIQPDQIINIQEYALPKGRSQIICWFKDIPNEPVRT